MADPHAEEPRGGSEAEGSAPDRGGDAPNPAAGRKGSPPLALRLRRAHAALAPWVLAPLLLTVTTGLAYRLLRDWGGLGRDPAHGLMVLHEGEWLRHWFGPSGETLYVLANGLGLLWMLATGGAMLWQRWRRPGIGQRVTREPVQWLFGQAMESWDGSGNSRIINRIDIRIERNSYDSTRSRRQRQRSGSHP